MHAFEDLADRLLRREGYWTRHSVKVSLTADDKRSLGKPSLPRPEHLIAYRPASNVLALVECKSYLDSPGVSIGAFNGADPKSGERLRLFTDESFRELVTKRVVEQLEKNGSVRPQGLSVEYWLVAGHIASRSKEPLTELFKQQPGSVLKGRTWIAESLQAMQRAPFAEPYLRLDIRRPAACGW